MTEEDFLDLVAQTLMVRGGMHASLADELAADIWDALSEVPSEPVEVIEWEWGVEYEIDMRNTVFTAAHDKEQAVKWVEQSPTDTGLRRRRAAGPWEQVDE